MLEKLENKNIPPSHFISQPLYSSSSSSLPSISHSITSLNDNLQKDRIIISKRDYLFFSLGFSLSVVPVVIIFTFSSAIFSLRTGGIGNSLFCFGYTFSSLFFTRSIINSLGCKSSIFWSHFGNIFFVILYVISISFFSSYSSIIYPFGAFIGGISQSIMWVAKGKYFAITTHFFISSMKISEIEKIHREMAFLFHQIYLLNLIVGFTLTSISFILTYLFQTSTVLLFLLIYGIYVSISSYLLFFMNPIGDTGDPNIGIWKKRRSFSDVMNSISQMSLNRKWKTIYLLPYHICWGLIHSLWVYYILGSVIGDTHFELGGMALLNSIITFLYAIFDKKYISTSSSLLLLLSLSSLSSSSSSSPLSLSSSSSSILHSSHNTIITNTKTKEFHSKPLISTSNQISQHLSSSFSKQSLKSSNHILPLFLGGIGYISIGILLLFVDIQYKRSSSLWILTLITVLHGFIRSICENNMIATLADYFPQKETTTYLIMGTVKTFTCGICFFGFGLTDPRHMNKRLYGFIIVGIGFIALLGCSRAEILTQIERKIDESDEIIKTIPPPAPPPPPPPNNHNNNNISNFFIWIKDSLTFGNNNQRYDSNENINDSNSTTLTPISQQSLSYHRNNNQKRVLTTDLSSPLGIAVLKGITLPGDQPISINSPSFGYPTPIPPLPYSLRLISKDSSETESVIYVAEYF